jgi:hypothetical protein
MTPPLRRSPSGHFAAVREELQRARDAIAATPPSDPPDTVPETPSGKSSDQMRAVRVEHETPAVLEGDDFEEVT